MAVQHSLLETLEEAWRPARAAGVLGPAPLAKFVDHAAGYISSAWRIMAGGCFIDCGTGSGVLGVLLALEMPSSRWALVDASERRCEFAQRAVNSVGLNARVKIEHAALEDVSRRLEFRGRCDGVVARGFGPAAELAECGLPLLKIGAELVVSVSPRTLGDWRDTDGLATTGCRATDSWSIAAGSYLAVRRVEAGPEHLPRRQPARLRTPLLRPTGDSS